MSVAKNMNYSKAICFLSVLVLVNAAVNPKLKDENNSVMNSKLTKSQSIHSVSRCPYRTNKAGVYRFSDSKLCNVFHECNCKGNDSICTHVRSSVCPIGYVFLNITNRCEQIELFGCETSYLQSINTPETLKSKNFSLENDYRQFRDSMFADIAKDYEMANVTGTTEFKCPFGANERFADPNICNIFHVCVSRGDQTYDQPFLCPFSSVFRVTDSKLMYCDKRQANDCAGKAFYRGIGADTNMLDEANSLLLKVDQNESSCNFDEIIDDKLFCNLYHICKNGREHVYMCENQLLFNPLSKMCDYPINVACLNKQIYKKSDKSPSVDMLEKKPVTSETNSPTNTTANPINLKMAENYSIKNGSHVVIHGVKIELNCPFLVKNYLIPDKKYCNVFHHCHGDFGSIFICDKGQAFDPSANGPEKSGVCNFEDMVNCTGKFILMENGERAGNAVKYTSRLTIQSASSSEKSSEKYVKQGSINLFQQTIANSREELVSGIVFDCRGKLNGHWRDTRYCDVFHACIGGEQKKTYSCAQLGERIYFDETTKRCEFVKNNPAGCFNNIYYQQLPQNQPMPDSALLSDEPNEQWKNFIRSREQFSCIGRMDGFYASRWCNVFYRCFIGVKTEFLCPKMLNSDRLWWVQHGSSQETPQNSAACVWPCETRKQCMSPGGSIIETVDGNYEESPYEADRVWRASNCASERSSTNDIFKIPDQDFSCIGLPEGNFYGSKYCNVFHRCTNGKRKDFQCAKATNSPYDLWWNEETNQCDWPCKVSCNKPVYGSPKLASEIQMEDRSLNEEECRRAKVSSFVPTKSLDLDIDLISSKAIVGTTPDENFVCKGMGLFISLKYCNVYYDCKSFGQSPSAAFYCVDGFFDNISKTCKPSSEVECTFSPQLIYPIISIPELTTPEEVSCSNTIGPYIIHSNRYCNVYYTCDGRASKPMAFRCYDRERLEDAVFDRESRTCESKQASPCQGEVYTVKLRYQSSPVDHTRLPDLQPLSCRSDQQYLAEHDKYCNLYHSCILGKYQMYVCLTIGSFEKTSYFYYTNGDCAAPNPAQCGPNKTIYPYDKLFPAEPSFKNSNNNNNNNPNRFLPVIAPSMAYQGHSQFGSVSLKYNLPYSPMCSNDATSYLVPHAKFCNIFYECVNGKLTTFACVDSSTGLFSGIFDERLNGCKPFNQNDCPTNSLYNPEEITFSRLLEADQPAYELKILADYSFKTESNFSCLGKPNGYYESEWCNIFYRCLNGKRIDAKCSSGMRDSEFVQYDLWWEHQNATYNPNKPLGFFGPDEDAKCEWPCKVKCQKPVWIDKGLSQSSKKILNKDIELRPECMKNAVIEPENERVEEEKEQEEEMYQAVEMENLNPSGFYCESDGSYRDPLFCNLFHICINKVKKTYQCKSINEESNEISLYDSEKKACVSKEEGFSKCNGVIFDANFMNLPAYRDLPSPPATCLQEGVFRAYDKNVKYCDLYYFCEKQFAEPIYFHCDFAVFSKDVAFFNPETKQCESSSTAKCEAPFKIYTQARQIVAEEAPKKEEIKQNQAQENLTQFMNLKDLIQQSPYMMQIVSGLLDPAPGYLSLPSAQFQTTFHCPLNAPGYYPNNEFCDIFHYCYNNGQFKTYVCASMQNKYQLWWSHQTEPGRRDNIFCDWPCNLIGPNTVCPAHKRVLMRERQQVPGGISQEEVLASTCQTTNAEADADIKNQMKHEQQKNKVAQPEVNMNEILPSSAAVIGYVPCTNSNEWYVSPSVIKCSKEYRLHGFAPDPKDCSKFYRCEKVPDADETSLGYLMSCVAGLWWDQSRRLCTSPSEVQCNPYNIINSFGTGILNKDAPINGCRGLTCLQVGLAAKNNMKNIPGKPSSFYKCDGKCAIEMRCPLDLVFDNESQRCEWLRARTRMGALKLPMFESLMKNKTEQTTAFVNETTISTTQATPIKQLNSTKFDAL